MPQDYAKAAHFYKLAADQGNQDARVHLGLCYTWGHGVEQDRTKAVEMFHIAAEAGDMHAQSNLGNCYNAGEGVAQDFAAKAARWHAGRGLCVLRGLRQDAGPAAVRQVPRRALLQQGVHRQDVADSQASLSHMEPRHGVIDVAASVTPLSSIERSAPHLQH